MLDREFYIKFGFIYGAVNIIYLAISYIMGIEVMMGVYNSILSLLVGLGLMIFMGIQVRNAKGDI